MTSCPRPRWRHLAAVLAATETRRHGVESRADVTRVSRRSLWSITGTGASLGQAGTPLLTMAWVITTLVSPRCPGITDTTWTRPSSRPPSPAPTPTLSTFTAKSLISSGARILKVNPVGASNRTGCVDLDSDNDSSNNEAQLSFHWSVNKFSIQFYVSTE